jgi:nickel transport protein
MRHVTATLACALAIALLTAATAGDALAHRVYIFAWAEGNTIHTESAFGKDQPVKQGVVEVRDATTGEVLLTGETDEQGLFSFPVPQAAKSQAMDLELVIQAGEGHKGDWLIKAGEYLPAQAAGAAPEAEPAEPADTVEPAGASREVEPAPAAGPTLPEISAEMERLLDAKLAPIRRELAAARQAGPGVAEVVGGIGWLVGLAGVAAYFRRRPR